MEKNAARAKAWTLGAVLAAIALVGAMTPALADPPPHAKARGHESRHVDRHRHDYDDARYYVVRDRRHDDDRRHYDDRDRHRHDRDCDHRHREARQVYIVERLPYGHRHIDYRGARYYYDRHGHWYRPHRGAWARIAPPAGLVIDSRGIAVVAHVPIVRW